MRTNRTKLEGFLFWWLVACSALLISMSTLSAILPASIASVSSIGPTIPAILVVIVGIMGLLYFTWLMRNPSPRILLVGIFLFLLSAIRIEWADGLVGFTLGLPVRLTLVDSPSLLVQLDLIAFVISVFFAFAWYKRAFGPKKAQLDYQKDIVAE
jgi:hypothetical protein